MYRRTLLTVALTVVTLCSNALDVKTKISQAILPSPIH